MGDHGQVLSIERKQSKLSEVKLNGRMSYIDAHRMYEWIIKRRLSRIQVIHEIDAGNLHRFLGIEIPLKKWIEEAVRSWSYNAEDGDYRPMHKKNQKRKNNYVLSLAMARDLVLMQHSEKAREARIVIENLQWVDQFSVEEVERYHKLHILLHPLTRRQFLETIGGYGEFTDLNPSSEIRTALRRGLIDENLAREQRILNELVFTNSAMKAIRGELPKRESLIWEHRNGQV